MHCISGNYQVRKTLYTGPFKVNHCEKEKVRRQLDSEMADRQMTQRDRDTDTICHAG